MTRTRRRTHTNRPRAHYKGSRAPWSAISAPVEDHMRSSSILSTEGREAESLLRELHATPNTSPFSVLLNFDLTGTSQSSTNHRCAILFFLKDVDTTRHLLHDFGDSALGPALGRTLRPSQLFHAARHSSSRWRVTHS